MIKWFDIGCKIRGDIKSLSCGVKKPVKIIRIFSQIQAAREHEPGSNRFRARDGRDRSPNYELGLNRFFSLVLYRAA